ncbi:MAG: hypothetical protein JO083_08930 [Candidatus Eremiobacteraeota bacterium]|nr:hypothetical protein [Candidatus Eremiobacteraeota bacterium]MBV8367640.1 hypothetical protein [Candidatus Eremiobacteraeota bacterium]
MADQPWHGAERAELDAGRAQAPPKPDDFAEKDAPGFTTEAATPSGGGDGTWKRVVFSGNYGFPGCTQFQEQTYYNISEQEISQIAWTLFGLCPNWQARRYNA